MMLLVLHQLTRAKPMWEGIKLRVLMQIMDLNRCLNGRHEEFGAISRIWIM